MNIFDEMDKAISEFFAAADDFIKNEKDRFYNSTTISEFEEWDLWTLNESGDCSGSEQEVLFWRKVKEEEKSLFTRIRHDHPLF